MSLPSDKIIVEAPMSFAGATKRLLKAAGDNTAAKVAVYCSLVIVYPVIMLWYLIFGILLIPYRLIRRSQRSNARSQARHQETLDAIKKD